MSNPPKRNKLLVFMGLGFQMIATIAVLGWLGSFVDKNITNKYSAFTLIGLLVGVFTSLYMLLSQLKKVNNEK